MFSVLLVSNPSTLLDHTEARKAEKCVFFFLRPPTPLSQGLDDRTPLIWRLDPPLITRFRYIEVRLHIRYYYWGEEDRSLYRGLRHIKVRYIEVLLYDATSAQRTKLCQSLGSSVLICMFQCNTTNFWQPENTDTTLSWCFTTIHLFSLFLFSRIHFVPFLQNQLLH